MLLIDKNEMIFYQSNKKFLDLIKKQFIMNFMYNRRCKVLQIFSKRARNKLVVKHKDTRSAVLRLRFVLAHVRMYQESVKFFPASSALTR